MKIVLSAAMSQDGYLDDSTQQRLILSSPEDLKTVQELRAACDAILVGAETIRRDNPSLVIRDEELIRKRVAAGMSSDPLKVTITASGNLDPQSKFFRDGEGEKLIYRAGIPAMLSDLEKRGVRTLMIEGGAKILAQFLEAGLFDECRFAVAPAIIADASAPHLSLPQDMLSVIKTEQLGDTLVAHYRPAAKALMARAVSLSFFCLPSDKAYSVGAVIATPEGRIIATGYSREWEGGWHAEEIAIEKARRAEKDLRGTILYSSMEPCHPRLSGKTSCAEHIISAAIAQVVFCLREPPHFVACASGEKLTQAGVLVRQESTLAKRAQQANSTFF